MYLVEYSSDLASIDATSCIVDVINISNMSALKDFIDLNLNNYKKIVAKEFQCSPAEMTVTLQVEENMYTEDDSDVHSGYSVVFELEDLTAIISFSFLTKTIFSKMHKVRSLFNHKA